MSRAWNRLNANFVRRAQERGRGRYADGGGLYLQVSPDGAAAWVFQYERGGERRAMGIGSTRVASLSLARDLAAEAREKLARGVDPIDARRAALDERKVERAKRAKTFKVCAEEFHEANGTRWKNEKHRGEWLSAVRRLAYPVLGSMAVSAIDSGHVCKALTPLVIAKPVTAARLRGRIEVVLDYAGAGLARRRKSGEQEGDPPPVAAALRKGQRHPSACAAVRQGAGADAGAARHAGTTRGCWKSSC